ncbi:DUF805 domain-containing protein [Bosea sp. (in: a-proteobacteria)]|jgi:uncharacterized membrane protein YhaH (DUF805 family)|uniref:DUF805 domain-containing protein n=1 Tax=Bosea sp. (in: a-proteobacteria) TaxID=1871050 RepID=UPI003F718D16
MPLPLLHLLTAFDGRIGRTAFWFGNLLVALTLLLTEAMATRHAGAYSEQVIAFAGAFALFPWSALAAKRGSDRGRPRLYGTLLVAAIVLLGLGARLADASMVRALDSLALLLWLIALIDLGLLPAGDASRPVAELEAGAKRAG